MITLFELGLMLAVVVFVATRSAPDGFGPGQRRWLMLLLRLAGITLAVVAGVLSVLGTAWILLAAHFARLAGEPLGMLALLVLPLQGIGFTALGIWMYRRGRGPRPAGK